ncbi:hypothetical protein DM806_00710 [Sphingobium lactosutens]|uniref:hypothetical protein n=1 Tax=Sphingobium lactosutens TaxID=522773 RepID=UPI0015B971BC|nr:hypothetical protein [Sphingobium lactosutens]NWK94239.1 hypothetical protein [Sphingobium lactosutens]
MIRAWFATLTGTAIVALAACSPSPDKSAAPKQTETPVASPEGNASLPPAAAPNAGQPGQGAVIDENMSDDDRGNDTGRKPASRATQTPP